MHFSYFQKMSESPKSNCENCGGKVRRLITGGTGLIFKGSGFYLTDYKDRKKTINDKSESTQEKDENLKQGKKTKTKDASTENLETQKKEKKTDE